MTVGARDSTMSIIWTWCYSPCSTSLMFLALECTAITNNFISGLSHLSTPVTPLPRLVLQVKLPRVIHQNLLLHARSSRILSPYSGYQVLTDFDTWYIGDALSVDLTLCTMRHNIPGPSHNARPPTDFWYSQATFQIRISMQPGVESRRQYCSAIGRDDFAWGCIYL